MLQGPSSSLNTSWLCDIRQVHNSLSFFPCGEGMKQTNLEPALPM